jgi:hypothetical protein
MTVWEPDGWNFSDVKLKPYGYDNDSNDTSSTDSSDDEQIFAKSKILRKKRYTKIEKEELIPE